MGTLLALYLVDTLPALLGILLIIVGQIWFIIRAFGVSAGWGIACILFPPIVDLAFLVKHWDRASGPFWLILAGLVVSIVGALVAGG